MVHARDAGAEALAVVFLHSYANSAHETAVRELAREIAPGLPVILSSDVSPQSMPKQTPIGVTGNPEQPK